MAAAQDLIGDDARPSLLTAAVESVTPTLTGYWSGDGGTGVEVEYSDPPRPDGRPLTTAEITTRNAQVSSLLSPVIHIPVHAQPAEKSADPADSSDLMSGSGGVPPPAGRQTDRASFYGGAGLRTATNGFCSSGFAIQDVATARKGLLTAAHCSLNKKSVQTRDQVMIGRTSRQTWARDAELIGVYGSKIFSTLNSVYDGGPENYDGFSKPIVATGFLKKGAHVCTSGAMTGIHCDLIVTRTLYNKTEQGHRIIGLARLTANSTSLPNNVVGAKGDSGGPVERGYNKNWTHMQALAIISNGQSAPIPCGNLNVPTAIKTKPGQSPIVCYKSANVMPVKSIMKSLKIGILVHP